MTDLHQIISKPTYINTITSVKYYPLNIALPALRLNPILAATKIPLFVCALSVLGLKKIVRKSWREVNLALDFVSRLANCNLPSDEFDTFTFSSSKRV